MHDDDDDSECGQDRQRDLIRELQAGSPEATAVELLGATPFDDVVVVSSAFRPDIAQSAEVEASEYGAKGGHRDDQRLGTGERDGDLLIIQTQSSELILNRKLV